MRGSDHHRFRWFIGLIAVITAGLALPAVAHSDVVERHPAPETTLDDGSVHIEAHFSEELDGDSSIGVIASSGDAVPAIEAGLDLDDLDRVTLFADVDLDPGVYRVEWQAVSADDGDVTEGSWKFAVAGEALETSTTSVAAIPTETAEDGSSSMLPIVLAGAVIIVAGMTLASRNHVMESS